MNVEQLRVEVYRAFAETGRAPSIEDLARELVASVVEVNEGLRALADARHLALDGHGSIAMAHPFSAVPLGFSVMGATTLWWGGCAWDSFALPHLLDDANPALVATRCPACDTPHAWNVTREAPPPGDQVAHFLVPAARMWDDVVHTCGNQRIFCSEACVDAWLKRTGNTRGHVMDLSTLWRLASRWYQGRLDPGYIRREPSDAADYLRSVGLTGPFWGS
ncbi:organomercurial lyase [Actinomadura harenae]|uniref:Alkylmercury lyase n=1 Tax=Actinomadura harenae TaxID=2483351 RepID=A0A3M2LZ17_9ACTN|nr:organomercurial lyase [Actinomadura harenae]RMI42416.1 hypothetical protein EBO15_19440 [Actinomadura harenae]